MATAKSLSINDVRFKRVGVWRWFGKGGFGEEESEEEKLKLSGFLALFEYEQKLLVFRKGWFFSQEIR